MSGEVMLGKVIKEDSLNKKEQKKEGSAYGFVLVDTFVNSMIKRLPELPNRPIPDNWDDRPLYLKAQLINYWSKSTDIYNLDESICEHESIESYVLRFKDRAIIKVFNYLAKSNKEMFITGRINLTEFKNIIVYDLVGVDDEMRHLIFLMDEFHNEIRYMNLCLERYSKFKELECVKSARKVCQKFLESLEF